MSAGTPGPESRPDWLVGAAVGGAMLVSAALGILWKFLDALQQQNAAGAAAVALVAWAVAAPAVGAFAAMPRMFALKREIERLKRHDDA